MLKIYSIDDSWRGGRVVVAESMEEAIPMLTALDPYHPAHPQNVEEHEIVAGLSIVFMGDQ